jgi:hypothetical protein
MFAILESRKFLEGKYGHDNDAKALLLGVLLLREYQRTVFRGIAKALHWQTANVLADVEMARSTSRGYVTESLQAGCLGFDLCGVFEHRLYKDCGTGKEFYPDPAFWLGDMWNSVGRPVVTQDEWDEAVRLGIEWSRKSSIW